ncbi:MAG TPA: beta-ketoacyl-ACP synthase II [Candidatus Merdivicinus intestinigallinarum]|nr:beta-ketoacyl-ACP synthase II [Candidatus Merdivicinus intestinigallinarum]
MRRVVITGIGAITPIGNDVKTMWDSILAGKHGIEAVERFDTSDIDVKLAAMVKDFDPSPVVDKKEQRRTDLYCQYALCAAKEAMDDCGSDLKDLDPYRVGVIVGSGIGGIQTFEEEHSKYEQKGNKRVSVFFIPMLISNMAAGLISIRTGFKGVNFAPVTACATSSHAIGEAFRQIKHGYLDACITGGAEASVTKFALAGFNNMGALSKSTDPDRASIPFDKERDGFVMGEGAGMLVLEEYEHAKARGAHIYAEIAGYGATGDAYHITSPAPDGEAAAKAMRLAFEEAGLKAEDIDYVNAHGTSTPINERYETIAVKKALGDHAKDTPVSSTKSMTGHMLGAAGAVEAIITALSLENGVIPQTLGYKVPDEECDLDCVPEGPRKADLRAALSNSLGFGGHNATLCLKKYQD